MNEYYLSELGFNNRQQKSSQKSHLLLEIRVNDFTFSEKNKYDNLDLKNETNFQINALLDALKNHLYQIFHCRQSGNQQQQMFTADNYSDNRNFVEMLSNANTGIGTWEPGWEVYKIERNERLVVKKNGINIWLHPYLLPLDGNHIEIGSKGYVSMVKEFRDLLPGFYMAIFPWKSTPQL